MLHRCGYYAIDGRDVPVGREVSRLSIRLTGRPKSMHDLCMPTKTISLELDAYEKLKAAKRSPRESFSSVVRRAQWADIQFNCGGILELMEERRREHSLLENAALDRLAENQARPRRSRSRWAQG
jgi:hypothetical protein